MDLYLLAELKTISLKGNDWGLNDLREWPN